jgi:hypothetical protein
MTHKKDMKCGVLYTVVPKGGAVSGLQVSDVKPGCSLRVTAMGINEKGELGPLKLLLFKTSFDQIIKGCPDALLYTITVEHVDDTDYVESEDQPSDWTEELKGGDDESSDYQESNSAYICR